MKRTVLYHETQAMQTVKVVNGGGDGGGGDGDSESDESDENDSQCLAGPLMSIRVHGQGVEESKE